MTSLRRSGPSVCTSASAALDASRRTGSAIAPGVAMGVGYGLCGRRTNIPIERDRVTWLLYSLLGMVGFLLASLGAVLVPLQKDLGVERAQVAYYPIAVRGRSAGLRDSVGGRSWPPASAGRRWLVSPSC